MRYENGYLILDDAEIGLLSNIAMKKIASQYPAVEFIGSLAEMKDEAEKYLMETQSKQDTDERDSMRLEIVRMLIEGFDTLTEKAYEAADAAGSRLRWQ